MAENESPTTAARIPTKNDILNLLRENGKDQAKINEIAGDMGSRIAQAVEKKNLHKKAFGLTKQCKNMDPAKLSAFLTHWDAYRLHADLDKIAEELPMEDRPDKGSKAKGGKSAKKTGKDAAGDQGEDDAEDEKPSPFRQVAGGANVSRLGG